MSQKKFIIYMILSTLLAGALYFASPKNTTPITTISSSFFYPFTSVGTLYEAGALSESSSPYWWVNSGGELTLKNGTGRTVQGALSTNNKWRKLYAAANPTDTDNGYHPQNIFRLVTKNMWRNIDQQAYFKINKDQLSDSINRSASNGLLLFNRYVDSQNLYYTGVRVDGTVVIKKKKASKYYTLAQKKIFPGVYDRNTHPDLLPKNTWIGIRSEVSTTPENKVSIKVYLDIGKTGTWTLAATALDDGINSGGIIDAKASAGIRTDFMDVEFDNYKAQELK